MKADGEDKAGHTHRGKWAGKAGICKQKRLVLSAMMKLVIFDNDGVLVDSEALVKKALIQALATQGAYVTAEWAYKNLQGLRASDVIKVVETHTGVPINAKPCLEVFYAMFSELIDRHLKPTEHIKEALARLAERRIPVCVATSGTLAETYHKLAVTKLESYFPRPHIFSGEQVARGKPAPDLFLLAAKNMGFAPADCVVVEDAPFGVQGAKAAGMKAVGYTGTTGAGLSADDLAVRLAQGGAEAVISSHTHLLETLTALG